MSVKSWLSRWFGSSHRKPYQKSRRTRAQLQIEVLEDRVTPATHLNIEATDAVKNEGNAGDTTFTFTVLRSGNKNDPSSVQYAVTGSGIDSANAADFGGAFPSGTVNFASGEDAQVITINVSGDVDIEPDEGFTVSLSNPVGADIQIGTAAGTILNDDTPPTVSISATDAVKQEGDAGTTSFTFTVTRTGSTSGTSTVEYAVTGTGADPADADDFGGTFPTGTVTFDPTETSQVITIDVSGDSTVEPDENFTVTLSNPVNATIGTGDADGTIENDDTATLTIDDPTEVEGTGALTFTVTLDNAVQGGFKVAFSDLGITADGSDYSVSTSSPLTFAGTAGETQTITVNVTTDAIVEDDETLSVTLATVSDTTAEQAASITSGAVGTGTIENDDTATLTIDDPTEVEGTGVLTFTVTLDNAVQGGFKVAFSDLGITADGSDYSVTTSSPLTFAGTAGETQTITVNVTTDAIVEDDETLSVTLATVSDTTAEQAASITSGAVGTGTIENDDTATLTIDDPTEVEGTGALTFTVTLDNAVQGGFKVAFSDLGITADGSDYSVTTSSPLTFAGTAGETQTITVNVTTDAIVEDDETLSVTLATVSDTTAEQAASITSGAVGTGTIENDDTATLTIDDPTEVEGTGALTFTVTLDNAVQGGFKVAFSDLGITADGSDYSVSTSSPLTFAGTAGETQTITVNVTTDAIVEDDETLSVTLATVSDTTAEQAASITSGAVGTGTIENDDTATLTIDDPTVVEGTGGTNTLTFTVTLDNAVQGGFTVDFSTADITTDGSDYTVSTSIPLTFAGTAGETQTISVDITTDSDLEGDETFTITLGTVADTTAEQAASITTGAVGTGTIENDDVSVATTLDNTLGLYVNVEGRFHQNAFLGNEKWLRGTTNTFGNPWYFILPNGEFFEWSGVNNSLTGNLLFDFDTAVFLSPELLYKASNLTLDVPGTAIALALDSSLGFHVSALGFFQNAFGGNEKWIRGELNQFGNPWYFILPDGKLFAWNGVSNSLTGTLLADFGNANALLKPELLYEAAQGPGPNPTLQANTDQAHGLSVGPNGFFQNLFGGNEKWLQGVNNVHGNQWYFILPDGSFFAWSGSGLTGTLITTFNNSVFLNLELLYDAFQGPLTGADATAAQTLDSTRGLYLHENGLYQDTFGGDERWLRGELNQFGNIWYFILPTGQVWEWNGSATLGGAVLFTPLTDDIYKAPELLTEAAL